MKAMERKEIYKGRKFSFWVEEQRLPNGKQARIELVRHPGAVVILPQAADGRLFLLRQYRPSLGITILEFPAGTLEPGEDPRACAGRELEEEIGMEAAEWIDLGILYPAPGFCDEKQHCFLARGLSAKRRDCDDDEIIEVMEVSVAEVEEFARTGELIDAKSIAIFFKARLNRLI